MVVLGGVDVSYERGNPVASQKARTGALRAPTRVTAAPQVRT